MSDFIKWTKNLIKIFQFSFRNNKNISQIFSSWSTKFIDNGQKRTNKKSAFPEPEFEGKIEQSKPDVNNFKIESFDKLNWLELGQMISKLYEYLSNIDNGSALSSIFESADFLLEEVQTEPEKEEVTEETITDIELDTEIKVQSETDNDIQMDDKQENSNSDSKCAVMNPEGGNSIDGSTEDSDAPNAPEDGSKPTTKPKSRRRGSDLDLLGRWFFWKNRKYSQRQKNKQIERMEMDTTINGLLRKTLEKYYEWVQYHNFSPLNKSLISSYYHFRDNFDEESPFHPDVSSPLDRLTTTENATETEQISHEKFQERTRDEFAKLIKEIKVFFLLEL